MTSVAKVSVGALLLSEMRTIKEMREDVDDATQLAAGEITQHHYIRDIALYASLMSSSKRLQADLEQTLRKAKKRAREAAARRLQVELRALGELEAAAQVSLVSLISADIQAVTTSESVALAWRQKALYEAMKAAREERSVAEAVGGLDIDSNVTRAAATESAQAYNEGHVEATEALVAAGADLSELVDKWEAMLDACSRCSALDGSSTPIGEPFASGEEPGYVHVRCRCLRVTSRI